MTFDRDLRLGLSMRDADRLVAAFESGELVRPDAGRPNLVDLARVLAAVAGVEGVAGVAGVDATPGAGAIAERIGEPRHLVFVLADGLGLNLLESMPDHVFLRRHLAMELCTVFPSTTAVGLTTLATGEWPAVHGITGWWTYLREIDGAATVVKFQRRSDERSLEELGVRPEQLLPVSSLMSRMRRDTLAVYPQAIADSAYSVYATGAAPRIGYRSLRAAIDAVIARVQAAWQPTYTYLYTPRVDAAAHDYGTTNAHVSAELATLDGEIERLAEGVGPHARIVLSADHGHQDVPETRKHLIGGDDGLAATFRVAPSYDSRVMCFHLRDGARPAFREAMTERFGDTVFVLSPDEVEELHLLGPGPLSPVTRERLGDAVAITRGDDAIGYRPATGGREIMKLASQHSGLTPQQMLVPLVIA